MAFKATTSGFFSFGIARFCLWPAFVRGDVGVFYPRGHTMSRVFMAAAGAPGREGGDDRMTDGRTDGGPAAILSNMTDEKS